MDEKLLAALNKQEESLLKLVEGITKLAEKKDAPVVVTEAGQVVPQQLDINVHFEKFDETVETFQNYLDRLEAYFLVRNVPKLKKVHIFVSLLSPKNFSLLKTLLHPQTYEQKSYKDLTEVLRRHLNPTPLVIQSRHAFINRKQHEGEGIAQYMSELRRLAAHCKYDETMLNTMLRDVFVSGLRSRVILDRLFEEDDIDLTKTLTLATAIEKASEGTSEILRPSMNSVNKVLQKSNPSKKPDRFRSIQCLKCAKFSHKAPDCNATDLFCIYCKASNHVVDVCLKKKRKNKEVKHLTDLGLAAGGAGAYSTNYDPDYEYCYNYEDPSDDDVFPLHSIYTEDADHPPIYICCKLDGTKVQFELDSGSKNTILNLATFTKISPNAELGPCNSWLQAYNEAKILPTQERS